MKTLIIQGGQQRYGVVDFLKGFSIITIVTMHLIQIYMPSLPRFIIRAATVGGTGVHIFLICSGFGLYFSHLKHPYGFFDFLKRRFIKIFIPYIIVVAITALSPYLYDGNRLDAFLSHLFLFKMFIPQYEESFGVQFWYISTLVQFYLTFIPLCSIKKKIGNKKFLSISCIVSAFWWIFSTQTGLYIERIWGSFFLQYLWEFSAGMVVADHLSKGKSYQIPRLCLGLVSIAGLGLAGIGLGPMRSFNDIFAVSGYLSMVLLIYSFAIPFLDTLVMFISKISYELYLVHILIFEIVFNNIKGLGEYIGGLLSLCIAVMTAYFYHLIITRRNHSSVNT